MSFGASASHQQANSNSQSSYDPTLKGLLTSRAAGADQFAASTPYQGYTGQPLNLQNQGLTDLANYQAPQVGAAGYGASTINRGNISNVSSGPVSAEQIAAYTSPYQQQVVDATSADLNHQRQIELLQNAGAATKAGAWGGTGAAVADSLTNDNWDRNLSSTISNLRNTGFQTALGAGQQDAGRQLQAQQGNQQVDYNVAGANAGYLNQAGQFNATQQQQAQLANQQAAQAAAAQRFSAQGLLSQNAQAQYGAGWQQYLNQQQYPFQIQQLLNQSYGLLPTTPLSTASSNSSGTSLGFQGGAK